MPSRLVLAILLSAAILVPFAAHSQAPDTPMAAPSPAQARTQANAALSDSLQQLTVSIDRLRHALSIVNVARWKAPSDVRQTAQSDVDSIQRDLSDSLPSLVSVAQADPAKVAAAFSVYRNVDALYDVLLRVSETAQLADATRDTQMLEDQRATLEQNRAQLAAALLSSAQAQDAEVTHLRAAATAAPAPPPTSTVVDDGPTTKTRSKRTHKTTTPAAPAAPPQ